MGVINQDSNPVNSKQQRAVNQQLHEHFWSGPKETILKEYRVRLSGTAPETFDFTVFYF